MLEKVSAWRNSFAYQSRSRKIALLVVAILVVATPLTVFIAKKQQEIRQRASGAAAAITFTPSSVSAGLGDKKTVDVFVSPGDNAVDRVYLHLTYDPGKLTNVTFTPNTDSFPDQNPKTPYVVHMPGGSTSPTASATATTTPVTITSITPQTASIGAQVTIKGSGFTQDNKNVVMFGTTGGVEGVSSTDGTTIILTIPDVLKKCPALPTDPAGKVYCQAVVDTDPLGTTNPYTYPISVVNKNGQSNTQDLAVHTNTCTNPPDCAPPPEGCTYVGFTSCTCGTLSCISAPPKGSASASQNSRVQSTAIAFSNQNVLGVTTSKSNGSMIISMGIGSEGAKLIHGTTKVGMLAFATAGTPSHDITASPSPSPSSETTSGPAEMISPLPGSTIGATTTFVWKASTAQGLQGYSLLVGTTPGTYDIYINHTTTYTTPTSATIPNIPTSGAVYVTLWTAASGLSPREQFKSYTYNGSAVTSSPSATGNGSTGGTFTTNINLEADSQVYAVDASGTENNVLGGTTSLPITVDTTITPLNFSVALKGIDKSELDKNHPDKQVSVKISTAGNETTVAEKTGTVSYDAASGNYVGRINIAGIPYGNNYVFKVKVNGFLRKRVPGIFAITQGSTTTLPTVTLPAGDFDEDNVVDILDFQLLSACFDSYLPITDPNAKYNSDACKAYNTSAEDFRANADINKDGFINGADYIILRKSIGHETGDDDTGIGGGNVSGTPTPTPSGTVTSPPQNGLAIMVSPVPGSTIGSTTTFSWTISAQATGYGLWVGTTPGGFDIYGRGLSWTTATSATVSNIPKSATIYVRLFSQINNSGTTFNDYSYTTSP